MFIVLFPLIAIMSFIVLNKELSIIFAASISL